MTQWSNRILVEENVEITFDNSEPQEYSLYYAPAQDKAFLMRVTGYDDWNKRETTTSFSANQEQLNHCREFFSKLLEKENQRNKQWILTLRDKISRRV